MAVWIYQMAYGDEAWQTVDDTRFIDELYRYHSKITPYVKEMIHGTELRRGDIRFRLITE